MKIKELRKTSHSTSDRLDMESLANFEYRPTTNVDNKKKALCAVTIKENPLGQNATKL